MCEFKLVIEDYWNKRMAKMDSLTMIFQRSANPCTIYAT